MGNFGIRPLCRKWVIPDSNSHQERGTDPGSSSIRELDCGSDNLPPRCPPRLLSRYTFEAQTISVISAREPRRSGIALRNA
jgi:hypothetical protein